MAGRRKTGGICVVIVESMKGGIIESHLASGRI